MSVTSRGGTQDFSQSVIDHFSRRCFNASPEWLLACIEFCQSQGQQFQSSSRGLIQAAEEQWLATDLRTEGVQDHARQRFPIEEMRTQLKMVLPTGVWSCQILSSHDVGSAGYGQLQKLNNVQDENSRVSAEENSQRPYTAAWEPKPNRMLKVSGLQIFPKDSLTHYLAFSFS